MASWDRFEKLSRRAAANGYAQLDADTKLPNTIQGGDELVAQWFPMPGTTYGGTTASVATLGDATVYNYGDGGTVHGVFPMIWGPQSTPGTTLKATIYWCSTAITGD